MLVAMFNSFVLSKRRKAIQVFPESWRKLWNLWEIRITISLSLILQIILILLGDRRKVSANNMLRIILWLAYNTADSLATVSLSVLSGFPGPADFNEEIEDSIDQPSFPIIALWVPFLLLHLGGPDTITAYSLEDNDLWLRRLLQFGVQILVAIYVILNAWTNDAVDFVAIPVFITAIIKCGERIWVLWHVSRDHFKNSLLSTVDPGPNYARFMREYKSRADQGFHVDLEDLVQVESGNLEDDSTEQNSSDAAQNPRKHVLCQADEFFGIFKRLFADLILSFDEIQNSQSYFRNTTSDEAFKVIEIELGLAYDLFYTKAILIHSKAGVLIRIITLFCTSSVFCAFLVIKKEGYRRSDIIITYVLLVGAILLEIVAVCSIFTSDWAMQKLVNWRERRGRWSSGHQGLQARTSSSRRDQEFEVDRPERRGSRSNRHQRQQQRTSVTSMIFGDWGNCNNQGTDCIQTRKRWSNSMAQYNIIKVCLEDHRLHKCTRPIQDWSIYRLFEMHWYKETEEIHPMLKGLVFEELKNKLDSLRDLKCSKQLCAYKGNWVIEEEKCIDELGWSINEAEFDQSILLWHIATDLCYYEDFNNKSNSQDNNRSPSNEAFNNEPNCADDNLSPWQASRLLSNYMVYLLVMCPFMLPSGIGQIRLRDTRAEANEFFKEIGDISNEKQACKMLCKVWTGIPPSKVKGDRCKSVLFDGCRLAENLKSLEEKRGWLGTEEKWKLISRVWIEMLSYAASQCNWTDHAQQLRRGGELLTHVWFLMAHLGITEQFQVSQGHARAKLIVE